MNAASGADRFDGRNSVAPTVSQDDSHATMRLVPKADNVREARHFVGTCLRDWGVDHLADVAVLLTSEIVTNAVLHAGPHTPLSAIVVNLTQTDGTTRVEVVDGDIALPVVGSGDIDAQSGRGLLLLDALADCWGVSAGSTDKAVWFELN